MKLLIAKGAYNAHGTTFDVSWEQFKQVVRDHSVARSDESENEKKNAPWFGKAGENSTVWDSPSPKFIMGGSKEDKIIQPKSRSN